MTFLEAAPSFGDPNSGKAEKQKQEQAENDKPAQAESEGIKNSGKA